MRDKRSEALKRSIVKLARAGAHDEQRMALIAEATEAKMTDLLPDNWAQDGSLKDGRAAWVTLEERETYNDLQVALSDELDDMLGVDDAGSYYYDWYYVWVQDFDETNVYFQSGGVLYSAPYTVAEGGPVTIGDPTKVRPVTSYVSVERSAGACDLCCGSGKIRHRSKACPVCPRPQRTGRSIVKPGTVEWRRSKVEMMTKSPREYRHFATSPEIRESDDGDSWLFSGFASVYDVWYDMGWYEEQVALGAGRRTLSESPDVQFLLNHGGLPLARTIPGTLRLDERTIAGRSGLYSEADLDPADPDAQTLKRKNARGDLDEMSFAFGVTSDRWNEDFTKRVITTYSLHKGDVSVVNYGANPATSGASVRALNDVISVLELRAGKTLSSATMETLKQVLNLVANADDAVDEAQPLLAELMGVPNPDEDAERTQIAAPDYTTRARLQLAAIGDRR